MLHIQLSALCNYRYRNQTIKYLEVRAGTLYIITVTLYYHTNFSLSYVSIHLDKNYILQYSWNYHEITSSQTLMQQSPMRWFSNTARKPLHLLHDLTFCRILFYHDFRILIFTHLHGEFPEVLSLKLIWAHRDRLITSKKRNQDSRHVLRGKLLFKGGSGLNS